MRTESCLNLNLSSAFAQELSRCPRVLVVCKVIWSRHAVLLRFHLLKDLLALHDCATFPSLSLLSICQGGQSVLIPNQLRDDEGAEVFTSVPIGPGTHSCPVPRTMSMCLLVFSPIDVVCSGCSSLITYDIKCLASYSSFTLLYYLCKVVCLYRFLAALAALHPHIGQ